MTHSSNLLPYYAVIFTSIQNEDIKGYEEMANKMVELATQQSGFIGIEFAREKLGITVSYWKDLESIKAWKENFDHSIAIKKGKSEWYKSFSVRIAKVEREYDFNKED